MEKIVWKTEHGISIITPTISVKEAKKDIPKGCEYKIVDESEIPTDRTFRNAWTYDLKEDVKKSKEIWKEKLRAERKPLLESLDVEFLRAMEENRTKDMESIVKEKQKLRDITKRVDAAMTIQGIMAVTLND